MIFEIYTIPEALNCVYKMFQSFKNPERVFKNKLKKMGIKPLNNTISAQQLEEFVIKCYTSDKEENSGTFMERSVLAVNRKKSKSTLAAAIACQKQKNMRAV